MAIGPLLRTTDTSVEKKNIDAENHATTVCNAKKENVTAADGVFVLEDTQTGANRTRILSTESFSSIVSAASSTTPKQEERRVSFSDNLITNVWERPPTPAQDCPLLFWQEEDYQAFREAYRRMMLKLLEEKRRKELAERPSLFDNWMGWASKVASDLKQETISMSKALSQPPSDVNVFVDTMYLF